MTDAKFKAVLIDALNRDAHSQHKKYFESDIDEIFQAVKYLKRNLELETSLKALAELKLSLEELKESKKHFFASVSLYGSENARVNRMASSLPETPRAIAGKFKMLELSLDSMLKKIQYNQGINPKTGNQLKDLPIFIQLYRYWIKSIVVNRFELLSNSIKTTSVNNVVTRICKKVKTVISDSHGVNVTEVNKGYKFISDQFNQLIEEEKGDIFATPAGAIFFKSLNLNKADWNFLRLHVGDFPDNTESVIARNFIDPFDPGKQ